MHLVGLNAYSIFDPLVCGLRDGQDRSGGRRSHGPAGSEICRRDRHHGGVICDFTPTLTQNPKGLVAPRLCRLLNTDHVFWHGLFCFCEWRRRRNRRIDLLVQPLLVALLAPRWSGEAISWLQWLGLAIAMTGTFVVINARLEIGPPPLVGFGFATLALAGITLATFWEKRFGLSHHPVTENLVGYSAGLLGLLPFINSADIALVNWTPSFCWAFAYLVIGNSVIAVGLLLAMIRAGEVSRVSTLLFLVPPLAAFIAWIILDEHMPLMAWVGLIISGAGVYFATRHSKGQP